MYQNSIEISLNTNKNNISLANNEIINQNVVLVCKIVNFSYFNINFNLII
ncbi:MAG: hypothetical protein H9897_00620 [Candidatus Ureaplasma intestinipullorum]|uniref:Uncharacterized protein n=1 Tax=Candidatus Ureaplasma intestinipullorum TaxID=2838770 RepID=A0A9E2KWE2_9BACT|nr:hypothetical protein [Candidatus Ureaplasma intestinipullorum]